MYNQTIGKCGKALPNIVTRYRLPQTLISNVLQCKAISEFRYIETEGLVGGGGGGGEREREEGLCSEFWEMRRGVRA